MRKQMWTYITIIIAIFIIILPFILDSLIGHNILSFSPGGNDSWIGFWGSYIGAIIGASVVYFVAKIQIQKQDEQQMIELAIKGEHELRIDMRTFQATIHVDKIEEFIALTDETASTIMTFTDKIMTQAFALNKHPTVEKKQLIHAEINHITNHYQHKLQETQQLTNHFIIFLPDFAPVRDEIHDAIHQVIVESYNMPEVYQKYKSEHFRQTGKIIGVYAQSFATIQQQAQELRGSLQHMNEFIHSNIANSGKVGQS